MSTSPAPDERTSRPWRDFEGYVRDAMDEMKSRGWASLELREDSVRRRFASVLDIARKVGAEVELQDTSPPPYPGDMARIRLSMDGEGGLVLEDHEAFNAWVRQNWDFLIARSLRTVLDEVSAGPSRRQDVAPPRGRSPAL